MRAAIWRGRPGVWHCDLYQGPRNPRIPAFWQATKRSRIARVDRTPHPTHAAALAHAHTALKEHTR